MKTKLARLGLVLLSLVIASFLSAPEAHAATCNWTGAVSTDWATAGNWDCGTVPGAGDTGVIPNVTNKPVISSSVTVSGITINSNSWLTISSGDLTITGDLHNDGTYTYSGSGGSTVFNGTTNLTGNGIWTFRSITINTSKTLNAGSTNITLAGSFSVNGTFNGDSGTVTFSIAAATSGTVGGTGTSNFNDLVVNASGKTLNISSGKTISVAGDFTKTAGSLGCGTCTLNFNGAGTSTFTTADTLPWNISIQSGKSVTTSSTFSLTGNMTNDGNFTAGSGTITLNRSSALTVDGSGLMTLNNLTIGNSSGATFNQNATINGTLALTSGDLNTGSNTLTMGSSATTSGNYDVVGNVTRTTLSTGSAYSFGSPYTTLNFTSAPTAATVTLAKSAPSGLSKYVSRTYTINLTGGSPAGTVRLHYRDSELNGSPTESNLQFWRHNGTQWVLQSVTSRSTDGTDDNYLEKTGVSTFSDWAIAESGAPTAVTLSSFTASANSSSPAPMPLSAGVVIALGGLTLGMCARLIHRIRSKQNG